MTLGASRMNASRNRLSPLASLGDVFCRARDPKGSSGKDISSRHQLVGVAFVSCDTPQNGPFLLAGVSAPAEHAKVDIGWPD